jgi:uncharacterized protein (DUF486 family)
VQETRFHHDFNMGRLRGGATVVVFTLRCGILRYFEGIANETGPNGQASRRSAATRSIDSQSAISDTSCACLPDASSMTLLFSPKVLPILMLVASNVFMTFAWYGHLKYTTAPLWMAVIASWSIAFFEYWLAVPANRIGHQIYSAAELKTMQEVITLAVFAGFSVFYLKEQLTWNHAIGFALIATGAAFVFRG